MTSHNYQCLKREMRISSFVKYILGYNLKDERAEEEEEPVETKQRNSTFCQSSGISARRNESLQNLSSPAILELILFVPQ